MTKPRVLLHIPCYEGRLRLETTMALLNATTGQAELTYHFTQSSFSTLMWNDIWCKALNARQEGLTHYGMLHADLYPTQRFWIDRMLQIMEQHGAEALSAIVSFKDFSGLTSTAIDGTDIFNPQRFTLRQLNTLPGTFTHPHLLVNNGLMLVDLRSPWVERVKYNNLNEILDVDGTFQARSTPDDWFFSREVCRNGGKLYATREIEVVHVGEHKFSSHADYGQPFDERNGEAKL